MTIDPLDIISPVRYGKNGVPHDTWSEMRRESPVHWCDVPGFEPFWAITKHADITDISGQPEVFSNEEDGIVLYSDQQREVQDNADENPMRDMKTIIQMDPPHHRLYRKIASGFFTPRGISELDEIVAESARNLIDSLGPEGECDFVEKVSTQHPLRVLATILGIDREDEQRLLELTQQLLAGDDPDLRRPGDDRVQASAELGMEFYMMFDRIIQDRRKTPKDDLSTMLATAMRPDGVELEPMETFAYYLIIFTAGHDTTRNALSGALAAFLDNPDQMAIIREDPSMTKHAVEEIVRYIAPVNYMKRTAMRDAEVGGQQIRKGDRLVLFYASGNRDDEVFERPHDFDVTRHPNRHLGFGWAEHYCLGAHLARASMHALVEQLSARVELMEPAGERTQIESSFVVGVKELPVRYAIRPA